MKSALREIARRIDLRPEGLLRFGLTILIALAAGPEVFAAFELRLLLELLGATLFLTAYCYALRLLLERIAAAVRDILIPAAYAAMIRESPGLLGKTAAMGFVLSHATWWLTVVVAVVAWGQFMLRMFN